MPTPIVIAGRAGARRARRLIFRGRAPYLRPRDAYERLPPWWPPRDTGRVEPRAQAFAGRAAELETLGQALAAARAGRGAAILVAGEAGIGKTRLAAEITGRAREAGWQTLLGRSIDLVGTELPYQPFVEALRSLGELQQVEGPPAGSQLGVFEQTLALLAERAAAAPVLLVLEDLHWADTSTLDLLVFLAHNLQGRQVLLLGTHRTDEPTLDRTMAVGEFRPCLKAHMHGAVGIDALDLASKQERDGSYQIEIGPGHLPLSSSTSVVPSAAGLGDTRMPAERIASILDSAPPLPPEMIAPA